MADVEFTPASKACRQCGEVKPLAPEFFAPQKLGKYGFTARCRVCNNEKSRLLSKRPDQAERYAKWRAEHKDEVKAYNKAYRDAGYKSTEHVARWREKNLEYCRAYDREKMRRYREANPAKFLERSRRMYVKHRAKAIARSKHAYQNNPAVNLKARILTRLRKMLRGKWPFKNTSKLLGYTPQELRKHIERQFTAGMTWARMLAGEIHIDHIIPVRAFDIKEPGDAEFMACWSLGNLRPMWAADNHRKSGKVLTLL